MLLLRWSLQESKNQFQYLACLLDAQYIVIFFLKIAFNWWRLTKRVKKHLMWTLSLEGKEGRHEWSEWWVRIRRCWFNSHQKSLSCRRATFSICKSPALRQWVSGVTEKLQSYVIYITEVFLLHGLLTRFAIYSPIKNEFHQSGKGGKGGGGGGGHYRGVKFYMYMRIVVFVAVSSMNVQ